MSRKPSEFVTKEECRQGREDCIGKANIDRINLALFGQDGRGGIVKDIQDIKTQLSGYSNVLRQFGAPILVAVIVAVIVRFLP